MIDELIGLLLGLACLATPLVLLGLVIYLATRPRAKSAALGEHEAAIALLRGEQLALERRIAALEARLASPEGKAALAAPSEATGEQGAPPPPLSAEPDRRALEAVASAPHASVLTAPAAAPPLASPPALSPAAEPAQDGSSLAAPAQDVETSQARDAAEGPELEPTSRAEVEASASDAAAPSVSREEATTTGGGAPPTGGGSGSSGPPPEGTTGARPSAPAPRSSVGWEQWIGVRGAAALGSLVLILAALYFFQYSIEHDLIPPFVRVLVGLGVGLGCVLGSERLRRRYGEARFEGAPLGSTLANWLAGAGIAILYASSWAASGLYHLVPALGSGIAMVAVTAACVGLATRRSSLAIGVLGLFGGFVTPIALSSGEDHPIPLFTYLLLLDVALLYVARRKRWPALAILALVGTALYQLAWFFGRMSEASLLVGLAILLVFPAVIVAMSLSGPRPDDPSGEPSGVTWLDRVSRIASILSPFVLAVAFTRLPATPMSFAATLVVLIVVPIGALVLAWRSREPLLASSTAAFAAGLLIAALGRSAEGVPIALHALALAGGPLLAFAVALELSAARSGEEALRRSFALAAWIFSGLATLGVAVVATPHLDAIVPWTVLVSLLTLQMMRAAWLEPASSWALVVFALTHGVMWQAWSSARASDEAFVTALAILHLALYQGFAVVRSATPDVPGASLRASSVREVAAAVAPLLLLLNLSSPDDSLVLRPALHALLALVLGLFVLAPAMRATSPSRSFLGALAVLAPLLVAFASGMVTDASVPTQLLDQNRLVRLGALAVLAVFFSVTPLLSRGLTATRWAWRASALGALFFFPALHERWESAFGARWIGALPILFAALLLLVTLHARARAEPDAKLRVSSLAWPAAAAMLFVTVAIPLQLDREWITIGWALEAMALLALYRRLDHQGLKWMAAALDVVVGVRLLANPYVLDYAERGPYRIFNWLSYTYLVPLAALVVGGALLGGLERDRLRAWERSVFSAVRLDRPVTALAYTLALLVGFAWINLTIFDFYATSPMLTIPMERLPARDLTLSLAWALYGMLILALGMWRASSPLRIASLLVILVTAGKVFLYDLANLRDLYRVAALVGLALSLITISLVYQRFVFRSAASAKPRPRSSDEPPSGEVSP